MGASKILNDAVCLGCGCLCDDVTLHVADGAVQRVERACRSGEAWFGQPTTEADAACFVAGERAPFAAAIDRAAELLGGARAPTVAGLAGLAVDGQRLAVAIADRLGGRIVGAEAANAAAVAMVTQGAVTASLGEVSQRADVVVFWRCDPATTHPRHFERYSLEPTSRWLPNGRKDRTVIAVGDTQTPTAAEADHAIPLREDRDYEALQTLQAIGRSLPLDDEHVAEATGAAVDELRRLDRIVRGAKHAAVFYGGGLPAAGHATVGALTQWIVGLNDHTRAVALSLGGGALGGGARGPNSVGAANALAWQTGYPTDVSFARGYPEWTPGESRGEEADALLLATAEASGLPTAASKPRVVLSTTADGFDASADVAFRVAPAGFAAPGSAYRSDGVALPLREPWADNALAAETVLQTLLERLPGGIGPADAGGGIGPADAGGAVVTNGGTVTSGERAP